MKVKVEIRCKACGNIFIVDGEQDENDNIVTVTGTTMYACAHIRRGSANAYEVVDWHPNGDTD